MFKTIQPLVWCFDAEWTPDPRAGRVLHQLPAEMSDPEVVVEMWRHGGATEEDPTPFLKTILCRVVSIAAIQRKVRQDHVELSLLWLPRDVADPAQQAEAHVIGTFLQAVGKHRPQLVGYNSHGADLKILVQRALVNGLSAPEFCQRPDKPWEGPDYFARGSEHNIDLIETLGSWGKGSPSLHEVASLSGIPGKFDAEGEDVAKMWLTGRWRAIIEYNCFDAITTYLVWLRMAHLAGHIARDAYEEEQELLRHSMLEWMDKPDFQFLEKYLEEWDRLQHATGQAG